MKPANRLLTAVLASASLAVLSACPDESSCPAGFSGSGTACFDADECRADVSPCSADAVCTNTPGSYTCACKPGFTGDGKTCTDVDECSESNGGCAADAVCVNTPGNFGCACKPGFTGDGKTCTDVDECSESNGGCAADAICTNLPGNFECACKPGFTGDGKTCTEGDECAQNNGGCDRLTTCTNTAGGRTCGACPSGYSGTGESGCVDINECAQNNGGCDGLTTCTNTAGGRTCGACPSGYNGTGESGCQDINECAQNNGGCPAGSSCRNEPGGRSCVCPGTLAFCGTICADLTADEAHCGQCGFPCELGDQCGDGLCVPDYEWANWPVPTSADSNYAITADTVTDETTGLVWQRIVPLASYTWAEAKSYCAELTLGVLTDWRLPTRIELLSIVDVTRANPTINPNAFPDTPVQAFWTSSLQAGGTGNAWYVAFDDGTAGGYGNSKYRVRCVR